MVSVVSMGTTMLYDWYISSIKVFIILELESVFFLGNVTEYRYCQIV